MQKVNVNKFSLSRGIVTRRVEQMDEHLTNELKRKADSVVFHSLALDKGDDLKTPPSF